MHKFIHVTGKSTYTDAGPFCRPGHIIYQIGKYEIRGIGKFRITINRYYMRK